jgi:hypothetical protein
MAYIGSDLYLATWLDGMLAEDALTESCIYLLGAPEVGAEAEQEEAESSKGYIIQDWFGPFLLGPASRYLRGRC